MTALVLRADARELPLPDASVDLIVTSPPYYGLRSYTDGGEHYDGQIGSEATPAEWLQAMLACTREWMRVLKPTGSIFVNLGDTYSSKANAGASVGRSGRADHAQVIPVRHNTTGTAPYKSLLLMPERYRIACVDELGLTARAVLVWDKPNGLPESVTDRVRRAHEDWVHLTLGPRYFASVDEIREKHARSWTPGRNGGTKPALAGMASQYDGLATSTPNPLGRLPGSVWAIASEPLKVPAELGVDHFAAFPMEWPRRLIQGWSPTGYCAGCGEPRQPAYARDFAVQQDCRPDTAFKRDKHYAGNNWHDKPRGTSLVQPTGEVCACTPYTDHPGNGARDHTKVRRGSGKTGWQSDTGPMPQVRGWREYHLDGWTAPPTRPAVVLDPFGGTGTTALVAHALGRTGITIDRSADYCRIARWRTTDPGQIAKAMRVKKPVAEIHGQGDVLAFLAASTPAREPP